MQRSSVVAMICRANEACMYGEATNAIPPLVTLTGTLRSLSSEGLHLLVDRRRVRCAPSGILGR